MFFISSSITHISMTFASGPGKAYPLPDPVFGTRHGTFLGMTLRANIRSIHGLGDGILVVVGLVIGSALAEEGVRLVVVAARRHVKTANVGDQLAVNVDNDRLLVMREVRAYRLHHTAR